MAWGSSFDSKPKLADIGWLSAKPDEGWSKRDEAADAKLQPKTPWPITPIGMEKHTKVWSSLDQIADEKFPYGKHTNKVPTHDPYTNPNAIIYYECKCGQILDPGTKRFAELNNCASNAGWKIRFSDNGYVPYCVECGKGVE